MAWLRESRMFTDIDLISTAGNTFDMSSVGIILINIPFPSDMLFCCPFVNQYITRPFIRN